jgi:uncharacterized protein
MSAVPSRLTLLTLGARDVPALRAFYEALWGPSPSPPGPEFAHFELGGAQLGLYAMPVLARDVGVPEPPAGAGFNGVTPSINVESAEAVDEVIRTAEAAGARVMAEPVTRDWGGRSGYFADPEGNVWEVAWVPGSSFDERGALIWPD